MSFLLSSQTTNKLPLDWEEGSYLCLSLNNVYLEIKCLRDQTYYFAKYLLFSKPVVKNTEFCDYFFFFFPQRNLQLWMILNHPQASNFLLCAFQDDTLFLRVFKLLFTGGKRKRFYIIFLP